MALSRNASLAVGGTVVVVVIVIAILLFKPQHGQAEVILHEVSGQCVLDEKPDESKARKAQTMMWKITNNCDDANRNTLVSVGNFRSSPTSGATNCEDATTGGAVWPFNENQQGLNHRQHTQQIVLPVKGPGELGTGPKEYYYDICIGQGSGNKVDPRLVIED